MSYNSEQILLELYRKTGQNIDPHDPILKVFEAQQVIIDFFSKDISVMHETTKETLYNLSKQHIAEITKLQEQLNEENEKYINGITKRTISFLQQSSDNFSNSLTEMNKKLYEENKTIQNTITTIKKNNRNIFYVLLALAFCNIVTLIFINYCIFKFYN